MNDERERHAQNKNKNHSCAGFNSISNFQFIKPSTNLDEDSS
jgi:hypothetical protein